ncbi:MAG: T9SS type A sorting domain-containing protein [Rhodothermales bacterium]
MTLTLPHAQRLAGLILILAAGSAHAQSVPVIGTPESLDVAAWNIEWFGDPNNGPSNDAQQIDNVGAIIAGAGIDLWAVEEIADADDFDALLAALGPDFDGRLATNSGSQRIGFVYDTRVVRPLQVRHILEEFDNAFAGRPPLQLEAEIMLPDTTVTMTFIVVHMKAFSDTDSYDRRAEAATRLKNHVDFTSLEAKPVVIMGDFNDEMDGSITSGRATPYAAFVEDTADFSVLTLPLELAGDGTFCANANCTSTNSMIDHIVITDELFAWSGAGATAVLTDIPMAFTLFANTTSDHVPVYTRLTPPSVSTAAERPLPHTAALGMPYPNPFSATTTLTYSLAAPGPIDLRVYDILGREVKVLVSRFVPAGAQDITLSLVGQPAGVYFVRSSTGEVRQLVKSAR